MQIKIELHTRRPRRAAQDLDERDVIHILRLAGAYRRPARSLSTRAKVLWTLGNALMLLGVILLAYVGGLYAQAEYGRYAARGDTDVPPPRVVARPDPGALRFMGEVEPAPFIAPLLNVGAESGRVVSDVPAQTAHVSTVARIVIPSIEVDSKVVEVGWDVQEVGGQQVAVWQVAEYAVGQHRGSSNPGEGDNIVLAGHVGGYGKVFKDLIAVKPGDSITLYSGGQQYLYTVSEQLVVKEEGVSPEQQEANARYIGPTGHEVVTLVTCWPPRGPEKFQYRVIVRAVPYGAASAQQQANLSSWSIR
ncbi:MAG TPA: sortase [Roseiflexaceae bacterium]|nr:sortase [Roseiflexaceae bacterium]